jgi:hypothetical protein
VLFWGVEVGRVVVVDVGEELVKVLAGDASVGVSFQFLPDPHQVFLVFDLSEVVKLFQQPEGLLDAQEALRLSQVRMAAVVQLLQQSDKLHIELLLLRLPGAAPCAFLALPHFVLMGGC